MHIPKARKLPSGKWFCRVRIGGQDVGITRATEKEAVAEAMALKAGLVKTRKSQPAKSRTLRVCIDDYIRVRAASLSPSTIKGYRGIQRNRMPLLMDREVSRLNERIIQQSINEEAAVLSPKTLANAYGLLFSVLLDEEIYVNRRKIHLPKLEKRSKKIYERCEIGQLLRALRGTEIEAPILLGLMLGLRRSEICALEWEDIDFSRNTIHVCRAVVYDEDNNLVQKGSKNDGSNRFLPNCP